MPASSSSVEHAPEKHAILAGASGLIGSHLLTALLEDPAWGSVLSLVRRPGGLYHAKLSEETVDFDRLQDTLVLKKPGTVFCCLGTTMAKAGSKAAFRLVDHDYPLALARLARDQGCDAYHTVSSMGADAASPIFYNRVKGEVERDLRALEFDSLSIYRPSLLLGSRDEDRPGESIAQRVMPWLNPLLQGPLRAYRPIKAADVAKAMLVQARRNDEGVHVLLSHQIQDLANQPKHAG